MFRIAATIAALAIGLAITAPSVSFADMRSEARRLMQERGDAVVTLEIVQKTKVAYMGQSQEEESKSVSVAVIVDGTGLAVTALSSVDRSSMARRLYGERDDFSIDITIKEAKFILADNTEVPAMVVLRDPDLDLAFLRPAKGAEAREWTSISLAESGTAAELDEVFTMARMGRIARRGIGLMTGEVQSIVKRPRLFYIPAFGSSNVRMGSPVFTGEGKLLGMLLYHAIPGGAESEDDEEPVIAVVVPASDIAELAAQAPTEAVETPVVEEEPAADAAAPVEGEAEPAEPAEPAAE